MRAYSIDGAQAVASPTDTVLGVTGTSSLRPKIYHGIFGSLATPAQKNSG